MDPFSIVLLMMLTLGVGGAGRVSYRKRQKRRRELMREAILTELALPGQLVSIYDLFWDLGVSDYALEIMASRGLLPEHPDQLPAVRASMREQIMDHGSYEAFVHDLISAIEEFYRDHQRAGHRRQLPTLRLEAVKLLPAPAGASDAIPGDAAPGTSMVTWRDRQAPSDALPEGYLLDIGLEQRSQWRETRAVGQLKVMSDASGQASVDIDHLLKLSPGALLQSMFQGRFRKEALRWFDLQRLRQLRRELDVALSGMFEFFDRQVRQDAQFFKPLYDLTLRWREEAERIERLEAERGWAKRSWALAADVLVEEARIMARYLERHARKNADEAIASLRQHAQRGDLAMAGYLVYINHYAFMAGCREDYSELVRAVEFATHKIQQEMGQLRVRGVI